MTPISFLSRAGQGQFHKFFGHPMNEVESVDGGEAGIRVVTFLCRECGRNFKKQICKTCGR